ncbi:MAG: phosphomethylpyrimidine synthase ThiC [Promethearchaeota archaeon]|jgi:phosphomethylpyrimidine synthase
MTILEDALKKYATDNLRWIAQEEKVDLKTVFKVVSKGTAVVIQRDNNNPVGIGYPFRTKINVNLGTSTSLSNFDEEIEKVKIAEKFGADTISDLSMGGNINEIRKKILDNSSIPITTVPIYQVLIEANSVKNITEEKILKTIETQLKDGISSVVLHCGLSLEELFKMKGRRIMGMVSKGGSYTAAYMVKNSKENPFIQNFDVILELLKEYDVVLNLGNAMRSGCIHDVVDEFQLSEIKANSKLAKRANKKGVQVIIESLGGHVLAKDLIKYTKLYKKIAKNRPLFVAGPLPTDFAPGYDHIVAAIGATFATGFGADYLCAITPAEHLSLPTVEDIKQGLIASRIAAHIGDSFKFGLNHLFNNDLNLSTYRYQKNWQKQFEISVDPTEPQKKHPINEDVCSMCGKHCALSISQQLFNKKL